MTTGRREGMTTTDEKLVLAARLREAGDISPYWLREAADAIEASIPACERGEGHRWTSEMMWDQQDEAWTLCWSQGTDRQRPDRVVCLYCRRSAAEVEGGR
jgi:hypothetical protein